MKAFIPLVLFTLSSIFIFAQDVKIVSGDDLSTDISGTTIEIVGDKTDLDIHKKLFVVNLSGGPLKMAFKRKRELNSELTDQICDNNLCYSADDTYLYTTPAPAEINNEDTSLFKPQIVPNNTDFCAIHKYYVVSPFEVIYDSITIKFRTTNQNCFLSLEKQEKQMFNIYPNPTHDRVNLQGQGLKNGGTVVFLDALGKEVKRATLSGINTEIAVNDLRKGVYFVSITDKAGTKSKVQRLIIQ